MSGLVTGQGQVEKSSSHKDFLDTKDRIVRIKELNRHSVRTSHTHFDINDRFNLVSVRNPKASHLHESAKVYNKIFVEFLQTW